MTRYSVRGLIRVRQSAPNDAPNKLIAPFERVRRAIARAEVITAEDVTLLRDLRTYQRAMAGDVDCCITLLEKHYFAGAPPWNDPDAA